MNNKTSTIHDLRRAGAKVRVLHRMYEQGRDEVNPNRLANDGQPNVTEIQITMDEKEYIGIAYRASGDNYDRKKGNLIALGRALKRGPVEMPKLRFP